MANWIPVTVVPTSFATVAMETFMTELSRAMRNCADASVSSTMPPADLAPFPSCAAVTAAFWPRVPSTPGSAPAIEEANDYFLAADVFRVTAARMSAFSAFSLTFSPSWKSIARRTLPSRLELKRCDGSFSEAPLAKVAFTTLL